MGKDISDIEHDGDEYFDENLKANRENVRDTEVFIQRIDKKLSKKQREMRNKAWRSPENPYLWTPMIDDD